MLGERDEMKLRNVIAIVAVLCGAALCYLDKTGWGWFLVIAYFAYDDA